MDIEPITSATWPALAELFAACGDPKWCWCQFWRKPGSNWSNTTADDNRRDLRALVDGGGLAPGLVAIDEDGKAVGWVGLGPRDDFERLGRSRTLPQLPGDDVWAINCFVVAKGSRRSGVASALLDAAVDYARDHGAGTLEGYPVQTGGRASRRRRSTRARGDVRARRVHEFRAVDLEGRLRDAARGDAPGALTAPRRIGAGTTSGRQVHRQDQQRPSGREGEGRPVGREAWGPEQLARTLARSAHDPVRSTLT